MATDLRLDVADRPGTVAALAEALAGAGINILGGCGVASGDGGIIHLLVENAAAASSTLEGTGFSVAATSPAVVMDIPDRPGELAAVARKAAAAGVNLTFMYLATNTRLVLGADDVAALNSAVGG